MLGWPLIIESSYPILLSYASLCISWLRKIQSYFWKDQYHTAFDTLKQLLTTALILSFPLQQDQPFLLDCDAWNVGVGTVLSQVQDREEKVICYFSKCLSRSERLYCTTRKDLLAVVMAVNISITIWLVKILQLELIMGHFSGSCGLKLWRSSAYTFTVVHSAGRVHNNADSMSRRQCYNDQCQYCDRYEQRYSPEIMLCRELPQMKKMLEVGGDIVVTLPCIGSDSHDVVTLMSGWPWGYSA